MYNTSLLGIPPNMHRGVIFLYIISVFFGSWHAIIIWGYVLCGFGQQQRTMAMLLQLLVTPFLWRCVYALRITLCHTECVVISVFMSLAIASGNRCGLVPRVLLSYYTDLNGRGVCDRRGEKEF